MVRAEGLRHLQDGPRSEAPTPGLSGWWAHWWGQEWARAGVSLPVTLFSNVGGEESGSTGLDLAMLPVESGPTVFLNLILFPRGLRPSPELTTSSPCRPFPWCIQ